MHVRVTLIAAAVSLSMAAAACQSAPSPDGENAGVSETKFTVAEGHRHFAAATNSEVWVLLEKPDRTPAEDERMVHAAHASCYHWLEAGTAVHHQRGEWLIARVYAELGRGADALRHAGRCMEITRAYPSDMADFDIAYAHEALARAHSLCGDTAEARHYKALAEEAAKAIVDPEDRAYFLSDLRAGVGGTGDE